MDGWGVTKRVYTLASKWIVVPILSAILGMSFYSRVTQRLRGPAAYKIYYVGPLFAGSPNPLAEMQSLFDSAPDNMLDGVPVKFLTQDDGGDPAAAARIAAEFARSNEVLLVVGHVLSSSTKEALPYYFDAKPPVPVILTTETTTNILPSRTNASKEFPIFRLSPTDDIQAQNAYEFAAAHKGHAFWVVQDTSNPVYATYLAQKFVEQAQKSSTGVLLLSTTMSMPEPSTLQKLGVDWVFFAGDWRGALLLIRQLRALKVSGVNFILSDSCADEELLRSAGAELEGVYVTHPLPASVFTTSHYETYGREALAAISELIKYANAHFSELAGREDGMSFRLRHTLGLHRIGDARAAIAGAMQALSGLPLNLRRGETVRFGRDGIPSTNRFHVWQIRGGKFVDVE